MYYLIYEAYHLTPNLFKLYAENSIGGGGLIFGSMMMRVSVYTDRLEKVFLNSRFGSKTSFFTLFSSRLTSFVLVLWFYLASLILP